MRTIRNRFVICGVTALCLTGCAKKQKSATGDKKATDSSMETTANSMEATHARPRPAVRPKSAKVTGIIACDLRKEPYGGYCTEYSPDTLKYKPSFRKKMCGKGMGGGVGLTTKCPAKDRLGICRDPEGTITVSYSVGGKYKAKNAQHVCKQQKGTWTPAK